MLGDSVSPHLKCCWNVVAGNELENELWKPENSPGADCEFVDFPSMSLHRCCGSSRHSVRVGNIFSFVSSLLRLAHSTFPLAPSSFLPSCVSIPPRFFCQWDLTWVWCIFLAWIEWCAHVCVCGVCVYCRVRRSKRAKVSNMSSKHSAEGERLKQKTLARETKWKERRRGNETRNWRKGHRICRIRNNGPEWNCLEVGCVFELVFLAAWCACVCLR